MQGTKRVEEGFAGIKVHTLKGKVVNGRLTEESGNGRLTRWREVLAMTASTHKGRVAAGRPERFLKSLHEGGEGSIIAMVIKVHKTTPAFG